MTGTSIFKEIFLIHKLSYQNLMVSCVCDERCRLIGEGWYGSELNCAFEAGFRSPGSWDRGWGGIVIAGMLDTSKFIVYMFSEWVSTSLCSPR